MNASGKRTSWAPSIPASRIKSWAFSTVASRSKRIGAAWMTATETGWLSVMLRSGTLTAVDGNPLLVRFAALDLCASVVEVLDHLMAKYLIAEASVEGDR
jgi:hypothetical protein